MQKLAILTSAALLGAAALLPAQTQPRIAALTSGAVAPGPLVVTIDPAVPCTALSRCVASVPPPAANPIYAGGVAWTARHGGVWVTDGRILAMHEPRTTALACQVLCPPAPIPGLGAAEFATGLGTNESINTLWIAISNGAANRIQRFSNTCPTTPGASCPVPTPVGHVVGGLDTADAAGLVIYTSSNFGGVPANTIYFAPQTNPCAPVCVKPVPNCSGTLVLGPITGVAVDEAAYGPGIPQFRVYVTDGKIVEALKYDPMSCTVSSEYCCLNNVQDRFVGLGMVPSRATTTGVACTTGACPACPTLSHSTIGDPAIGNPSFTLRLDNAPAASLAYMFLNFGPCTPPGFFSPPLCAPLLVPLPGIVVVGGIPTGGGVGCTGGASVTLSVPLNTVFCGATFSSQFLVLCGGIFDNAMSNCLTWMISAS